MTTIYVVTRIDTYQSGSPLLYKTLEEAQQAMKEEYEAVLEGANEDFIFSKEITGSYAEVIWNDDSFSKWDIWTIECDL